MLNSVGFAGDGVIQKDACQVFLDWPHVPIVLVNETENKTKVYKTNELYFHD